MWTHIYIYIYIYTIITMIMITIIITIIKHIQCLSPRGLGSQHFAAHARNLRKAQPSPTSRKLIPTPPVPAAMWDTSVIVAML